MALIFKYTFRGCFAPGMIKIATVVLESNIYKPFFFTILEARSFIINIIPLRKILVKIGHMVVGISFRKNPSL